MYNTGRTDGQSILSMRQRTGGRERPLMSERCLARRVCAAHLSRYEGLRAHAGSPVAAYEACAELRG